MFVFGLCGVIRTALILGCEYACKDAVEVLLRNGADVTAMDGFNHDSYHYARLSKNQELVALVKSYLDSANKGRQAHWAWLCHMLLWHVRILLQSRAPGCQLYSLAQSISLKASVEFDSSLNISMWACLFTPR